MQNGQNVCFSGKKKNIGSKRKILIFYENIEKNVQVFNGYPFKNVTKYFCIFFHFRTFCIFFSFSEKNTYFWLQPPPPVYELVRNLKIFLRLPLATDVCLHQKVEQTIIYVCDMCIQGDCKFSTCLVKYTTAGSFLIHPVYARVIF